MNFIHSTPPTTPESENASPAVSGLEREIRDSKILVVDDQKMVRELLKIYLNAGGYQNLIFAADGDEALQAITDDDPDLVVLDLQMPRMGGLEVCQTLRRDPKYAMFPVLVQTAADSAEDRAEIFRSGATDMVGKPINDAELLARVGIHLQNRHMLRQLSHYRESMERDLTLARDMQHQLMPDESDLEKLHEKYGIEIRSHFETCDALGGDMWNVWPMGKDRMGFHAIDFTGHGVVASLNTFRFQSLVAATEFDGKNQSAYIAQLNKGLHGLLPAGQFATAVGGYIDIRENVIRYTAAAGPKPFLISPEVPEGMFLQSDGRPLGMTRDSEYEEREVSFPPGSSLFLYSDALTETPDMVNPVYDEDRMQLALTGGVDAESHPFDAIRADFLNRVTGALNDDLTMVMLSRPDTAPVSGS